MIERSQPAAMRDGEGQQISIGDLARGKKIAAIDAWPIQQADVAGPKYVPGAPPQMLQQIDDDSR